MSRRDDLNAAFTKLDKRAKILIGALLVVIIAGGAYFGLKSGSSSSTPDSATSVPAATLTPAPSATAKAKPTPSKGPATAAPPSQADPGRDPFAPLPEESVAPASQAAAVSTAAAIAAPVTPTPTPAASTSAATSHTLLLTSISGASADVTFDGTQQTVKAGDTIATGVVCVKVAADSIFVTYGNKAYAVAPGQTITF